MDFPCRSHAYEDLEKQVPTSKDNSMTHHFQLDQSPLFYVGLFHGYHKLYAFLVNVDDVSLEATSDFAMSAAVFLAEKILGQGQRDPT